MISNHKSVPSDKSKEILETLRKTVAETLRRKRKQGQYAVTWDGKKPVQKGPDAPIADE
jgi:hypothetical protein